MVAHCIVFSSIRRAHARIARLKRRHLLARTITETARHGRAETGHPVRSPAHERHRPGRRQERIARRNDRPARPARACAFRAGSRPPRRRFASSWQQTASRERIASASPGSTSTTSTRWPRPAPRFAAGSSRRRCPPALKRRDRSGLRDAGQRRRRGASLAVRSSATAEDLPDASFAGQQETFLNINGLDNILHAIREVFASLYNDRAIAYRVHQGFAHADVALSVGVQRMVRSDLGAAGVMFTLDTESGFDQVVFITVVVRPGRNRRAGRGEPGRVLRLQAEPRGRAPGDPAQDASAARRIKMVFADGAGAGKSTRDGRGARRRAPALFDHRRRSRGARALRAGHREALRPRDGHRMGPRRRRRQALHPAGAAGDREVARGAATSCAATG